MNLVRTLLLVVVILYIVYHPLFAKLDFLIMQEHVLNVQNIVKYVLLQMYVLNALTDIM